ncbi:MAG: ABC transporter permease subunit [Spirochaetaceae bacterium]|jgi:ABC-2 type transport system permease protein|nr:ABC transporter permease subunit [Spirochaetaceae bacterium]
MKYLPRKALALARKELYSYSISPAFYGIAVFFLLFTSLWFFYFQRFFSLNTATLRPFFGGFPLAFILVIPVITMKSWAEERKLGTVEILLSMPFSEWDLVLGKFFSSLAVVTALMLLTVPVPLSLVPLGSFDSGVILTEYAGAFLLGSSATALGLFLSSLSKNQAGAFLGSAVVLLFVMLASQFTLTLNLPLWLSEGINFISLTFHFESFSKGLIDTRDLSFFIITTALFLFFNTRVLLFRKWR